MAKVVVKENEAFLDDIRTITALFSDVMQDFIMSEISIANQTNKSIKISSITLTILQIIILLFSVIISMSSFVSASKNINSSLADMKDFSSEIAQGNLSARTSTPDLLELKPLAKKAGFSENQMEYLSFLIESAAYSGNHSDSELYDRYSAFLKEQDLNRDM
jgi:two-component system sensor histidine kinase YesM